MSSAAQWQLRLGTVGHQASRARSGDPARPLAAAELVAWTVLAFVGCALLLVLRLFAPSDEQSVRLTLAWSSCLVPAAAGVAALRRVRGGGARTAAWRSRGSLVLTVAGAVVVLVLTRLA